MFGKKKVVALPPDKLMQELARRGPNKVDRGDLGIVGMSGQIFAPQTGRGLPAVAFGHGSYSARAAEFANDQATVRLCLLRRCGREVEDLTPEGFAHRSLPVEPLRRIGGVTVSEAGSTRPRQDVVDRPLSLHRLALVELRQEVPHRLERLIRREHLICAFRLRTRVPGPGKARKTKIATQNAL